MTGLLGRPREQGLALGPTATQRPRPAFSGSDVPPRASRDVQKENVGRKSLLLCKRVITVWEEGIHSEQVATGTEGRGAPGEKRKGDGFRAQCRAGDSRVLPPAWARCAHKHGGHVTGRHPVYAREDVLRDKHGLPAGKSTTHNTCLGSVVGLRPQFRVHSS